MKTKGYFKVALFAACVLIQSTSIAQIVEGDSTTINLRNVGASVNSKFSDFAPVINADGSVIMFTSRRPVTKQELKADTICFERIFITQYYAKGDSFSTAIPLGPEINDAGRNNSAISLSNDGQTLLIYRDDDKGNGDIYESKLAGNKWSKAKKLPEPVNSPSHESSAWYGPDGNTLYFVSQRPGGVGGRDIWSCRKSTDGKWGKAINLGPEINTVSDEEGIFMHPDGSTIFFSSKAHGSTGGYDIFTSKLKDGKWSNPVSLGKPLNTSGHDVFLVLDASGSKGYYASAASGGLGSEDIYLVNFIKHEKETGPRLTLLKGKVYDEKSGALLSAKLIIVDNTSGEKITELTTNSASGRYMVSLPAGKNYGISITSEGYLFQSVNVNMPDTSGYSEVEKDIPMRKLEVGTKIVLNNIFYDFDKSTLRSESVAELERLIALMRENPSMKIELSSHTDSKGTDDYNMRLSQARAQSVVDYLKSKNIDAARMIAKGYGETIPVSTNDTDEGRQMNRRTEFKVLSK